MKKNYPIYLAGLLLLALFACGNGADKPSADPAAADSTQVGNPAIDGLTKRIGEAPNSANLYAARGAIWYQNEGYDEAIADLEKAISLDSLQPDYYHALSDVYMDYRRSRMAVTTMERAAKAFPTRIATLLKLAEFQYILQMHNEALFTLERIRQLSAQNAEMFFMFGNVFRETDRKDQAMNAYQSAVENDPNLIDAWVVLAQMLAEKKSPTAERYFDNAIRLGPENIEALHAKAFFLSNHKNDLKGAIELYKKINTIDQQYTEGYYNLGLIYLDMDSVKQAFDSFDRAVKIEPQFADGYYHRGFAAEKLGNKQQALSDYQNTLNLEPEYAGAQAGVARLGK